MGWGERFGQWSCGRDAGVGGVAAPRAVLGEEEELSRRREQERQDRHLAASLSATASERF